jgi:hypothetical protein
MKWWDDLWLNEGFASYIEYKGLDQHKPEMRVVSFVFTISIFFFFFYVLGCFFYIFMTIFQVLQVKVLDNYLPLTNLLCFV